MASTKQMKAAAAELNEKLGTDEARQRDGLEPLAGLKGDALKKALLEEAREIHSRDGIGEGTVEVLKGLGWAGTSPEQDARIEAGQDADQPAAKAKAEKPAAKAKAEKPAAKAKAEKPAAKAKAEGGNGKTQTKGETQREAVRAALLAAKKGLTIDELMEKTGIDNKHVARNWTSYLKNPKYAGPAGPIRIEKGQDGRYRGFAD